ncbi:MAG: HAD family hydrolase [Candidatus Thermoplasmatota archaeon]|nr:HAD family hydrolase [Candidatus Thermoplasmatota archaeon]
MIKIISFDLDNTLVTSKFADLVWLEGLPKIYSIEKNVSFDEAKNILIKAYDEVGENKIEWYDLQYWFNRYNLVSEWGKLLDYYRFAISLFPEVKEVLEVLSKKFELAIITNAKREFINTILSQTNIEPYFNHIFSSTSDFHEVKKTAAFYKLILEKLDISNNEIIHVGDHEYFDVAIPKSLNIVTYHLDRNNKKIGDNVIHDLGEFEIKVLGKN